MFDFEKPHLDMYLNIPRRRYRHPIKIHRAICPHCNRHLLTIYWSEQIKEYICRECMDVFIGERKEKTP